MVTRARENWKVGSFLQVARKEKQDKDIREAEETTKLIFRRQRKTWRAHCWSNGEQSGPLIETHTANSEKYAPVLPTAATSSAWKSWALLLMLNHFLTKLLDHESCESQQHIKGNAATLKHRGTEQNRTEQNS
jgi:hypothetical protein